VNKRRFDLLDQKGKTVISLDLVRESMVTRNATDGGGCAHIGVEVDPIKATLECVACKAQLSPTQWIYQLIEYWDHVVHMHDSANRSRRAMEMQAQMLERKSRCKCDHCGRVTRVRLPRLNYAQLRSLDQPAERPPTNPKE
jgi:hypothetical protein